jgi:hypothetical protein
MPMATTPDPCMREVMGAAVRHLPAAGEHWPLRLVIEIRQECGVDDFELRFRQAIHQFGARQTMRSGIRNLAFDAVIIDAGNLEQGNEASLSILAALGFGEVDGIIVLADSPAKLNASVVDVGECGIHNRQNCEQEHKSN